MKASQRMMGKMSTKMKDHSSPKAGTTDVSADDYAEESQQLKPSKPAQQASPFGALKQGGLFGGLNLNKGADPSQQQAAAGGLGGGLAGGLGNKLSLGGLKIKESAEAGMKNSGARKDCRNPKSISRACKTLQVP